jgi:hypothetical protein
MTQCGSEGDLGGSRRGAAPQRFEQPLGLSRAACREALDEHRAIQRAGARPSDDGDAQPLFLKQPIQHAPGKCAERTAALQS